MTRRRAAALIVFLTMLVTYLYVSDDATNWNTTARMDLIYAVAERGVLEIDEWHANTGDKAFFRGHYYSDKSIGTALLGLPFYLVLKAIVTSPVIAGCCGGVLGDALQRGPHSAAFHQLAVSFVTFFVVSLPSALVAAVTVLFAARFAPLWAAVLAGVAYGLGTLALPYGNVLFGHQLAAALAFGGFYVLWLVAAAGGDRRLLWLAGTLLGAAAISEYATIPMTSAVLAWAAWRLRSLRALVPVIGPMLPFVALQAAYNWAAFGHPLVTGYAYEVNFPGLLDQGLYGFVLPTPDRLYGVTFSPFRGLFYLSPFLLLAVPGTISMWRAAPAERGTVLLIGVVAMAIIIYGAAYVIWWGGWSVGPRHLAPMLPFLVAPIACAFAQWLRSVPGAIAISLLVFASIANVGVQALGGSGLPADSYANPLFDYSLPRFLMGDIRPNLGTALGLGNRASVLAMAAVVVALTVAAVVVARRDAEPRIVPSA